MGYQSIDDDIYEPKLEPQFLRKLDWFLMSSAMLSYFAKYLNQANLTLSYNNGMDKFFDMENNQFNYLLSISSVGYILGQIITNYLLQHGLINFRYFIGSIQVIWCIIDILQYNCTSLNTFYVLRFSLAVFEAPLFIILEFLLGSWYNANELHKRATLLSLSSGLASVIAGPLQQLIIEVIPFNDVPPFKINFLLDACISLPIALYSMIAIPNLPQLTNNWYWSAKDKVIAIGRRRSIGADVSDITYYDKSYYKWELILFPLLFWAYNNTCHASSQPTLATWIKIDLDLSSRYYNLIPSVFHVLGMVLAMTVGHLNDKSGGKLNHVFVSMYFVLIVVGCSLLSYWKLPLWLHWLSYGLISVPTTWGQPQIFSWLNHHLMSDNALRSLVVFVTNTFAYVVGSIVPIYVWNTNDKPRYFIGFVYTTFLGIFGLVMTFIIQNLITKGKKINRTYV